jgi:general secretion pathway protein L
MFLTKAKTAATTALAALAVHARQAKELWWKEAQETLPAAWLARLGRLARPLLTLRLAQGEVCGHLEGASMAAEATWPARGASIGVVSEWLKAQQLGRDEVRLEVELEPELFLQRKMVIPRAALDSLPVIVAQEVVHRTPFEPAEIWHAAVPSDSPSGPEIIEIEHWIIRRDRAREALAQIGLTPDDVDALRIGGSDPRAIITLRETTLNGSLWAARAVRAAAAAAIAITLLGAIAVEWLSTREMTRIADAIADLRGQGNGANDPVAQLMSIKAGPKMLDVWDELSRLLPEHTYLNELRVVDGAATISGYSADAANLLRVLDQSVLFTAARLTGPITPDKAERKDRFTLTFRLRDARRGPQPSGPAVARSEP